jgi:tRNA pseudouridine55 synthase
MDGFIVIDKPAGMTSHDVVNTVRRLLHMKKVGHTGTLDPFATGVLPVALGEATKAIPFLDEGRKEYRAVMRLGETTDTQDCTGTVTGCADWRSVTPALLAEVVRGFLGRIRQVPPMFSALKRDGVPLYKLARRGDEVERAAREIEVFSLALERIELPEVAFTVCCSRGTYVRTLTHDMGRALGCGAHLVQLQRTMSGPFVLDRAVSLAELGEQAKTGAVAALVLSPYEALAHLRDLPVTAEGEAKVGHGIAPEMDEWAFLLADQLGPGEQVRISRGKRLLAVAETAGESTPERGKKLRLVRVFNQL